MSETNANTAATTTTQPAALVWARNPEEEAAAAAAVIKAAEEQKQREEEEAKDEGNTFVNHGFMRWQKGREDWHAEKLKRIQEQQERKGGSGGDGNSNNNTMPDHLRQSIPLDVDEIIDIIFSPRWRMAGAETGPPKRFPQNVPLVQMVDVLVDLWEAEGLDL